MSLKPSVVRDVAGDAATMAKVIGPKLGKRFSTNPRVARDALVFRFPANGVVTGRALTHALQEFPEPRGPILVTGDCFTLEARQIAQAETCDLVSMNDFVWTDAAYVASREPTKKPPLG